jgi:hypothetical protein
MDKSAITCSAPVTSISERSFVATVAASRQMPIPTHRRTIIAPATTKNAKTRRRMTTVGTLDAVPVWTGRPGGGIRFQRGDVFFVPFSFVWGGFALALGFGIIAGGQFGPQDLIVAFFAIFGLYIMFGRFLFDMYIRSQTTYALTADSAIIAGPFARKAIVYLPSVSNLNMTVARDGTGSIYFGDPPGFWGGGGRYGKESPAFLYIDRVADVFERCKRIQRRE